MKTIYCIHSFNALILWVYFSKQGDMSDFRASSFQVSWQWRYMTIFPNLLKLG